MMKDTCLSIDEDDFQEQTTMKKCTCCSIDGNKDAEKFNSEYKESMPNAETSERYENEMRSNQNHSITIAMWTVVCYAHFRISFYAESQ